MRSPLLHTTATHSRRRAARPASGRNEVRAVLREDASIGLGLQCACRRLPIRPRSGPRDARRTRLALMTSSRRRQSTEPTTDPMISTSTALTRQGTGSILPSVWIVSVAGFVKRTSFRFAALVGLCALLFATFSVAAYACPKSSGNAEMASMQGGCPDQDDDQPNLCKSHCAAGQQQTPQVAGDLPPLPLVHGLLASLFTLDCSAPWGRQSTAGCKPMRTVGPPATIRNCCFRL